MTRLHRILFNVLSWFSLCAGLPGAERLSLTLEQALASAEGVNISVLLGREAAAQALEQSNQVRVGLLPNVVLTAQQRRSRALTILSTTGALSETRPSNRFDGKFVANYSLLNAQVISATRAARAGVEVAQADYRAIVQLALTSVAQTYFTHLRNLSRLDVLDANIGRSRALLGLAQNQFAAG